MDLPEWIDKAVWDKFMSKRKEKKKHGNTPLAKKRLINLLTKLRNKGHDANYLIQKSIDQGWHGIWEPKEDKYGASNRLSTVEQAVRSGEQFMREHGIPEIEDYRGPGVY